MRAEGNEQVAELLRTGRLIELERSSPYWLVRITDELPGYVVPATRTILAELAKDEGIEAQIGTYALHLEPYFAQMRRIGDLANSTALYRNLLALPLHHELTSDDQERVVSALREALAAATSA